MKRPPSANRTLGLPSATLRASTPRSATPASPRESKPITRPSTSLGFRTGPCASAPDDYTQRLLHRLQDAHGTCAVLAEQLEKQRAKEDCNVDQQKRCEGERQIAQAQIHALRGEGAKMKKQLAALTRENQKLQDEILYWEFERSNE